MIGLHFLIVKRYPGKSVDLTSKKKNIFNVLFLLLVFGFTIYGVFKGEDLKAIFHSIAHIKLKYLFLSIFCVVVFIWGESIIIHYMMGTLSIKTKKLTCFMYSCIGFFFSCITPSASGGQPAQIYYMHKNKIPIPVSTLVLMIVTITYKSILVFVGLFLVIFQQGFIHRYLTDIVFVFYLGLALNVFCCIFMTILAFHPVLAKNMILNCMKFLEKIHIMKNKPSRTEKMVRSMDQYNATAAYLKQHTRVIVNVILISFFQRFALFFVTFFIYLGFGLSGSRMYDVVMLQAVISISVDMLPLPGGMGISESLFLRIFTPLFGTMLLLPGMILSRGIAYYIQLLLSALITVFAHFTIGKKKSVDENNKRKEIIL